MLPNTLTPTPLHILTASIRAVTYPIFTRSAATRLLPKSPPKRPQLPPSAHHRHNISTHKEFSRLSHIHTSHTRLPAPGVGQRRLLFRSLLALQNPAADPDPVCPKDCTIKDCTIKTGGCGAANSELEISEFGNRNLRIRKSKFKNSENVETVFGNLKMGFYAPRGGLENEVDKAPVL